MDISIPAQQLWECRSASFTVCIPSLRDTAAAALVPTDQSNQHNDAYTTWGAMPIGEIDLGIADRVVAKTCRWVKAAPLDVRPAMGISDVAGH
jgi:hypothetical protein